MNRDNSEQWPELIQLHLDGIASDQEVKKLSEKLESCSETRSLYLKLQQIHAILIDGEFEEPLTNDSEHRVLELISNLEQSNRILRKRRFVFTLGSIAAAVLVMLGSWSLWSSQDETIVEITSIQGAVQWTGDGGNVIEELKEGQALTGGTIETRSIDSVVELRFRDGSTVSISGGSVLTISDDGQKKLYLRSGVLSADVERQHARPMIVVTPAARLEILGTRFDVMANPERSKVSVRQGLVRAVRLSDGRSVKVAGGHSAIASTDVQREFLSRRSDQAVHAWKANLEQDRKQGEGEFVSAMVALRIEIREALQSGKVTREQIPEVYGDRLAGIVETDGVLKAQPKQVARSQFGNVIQIATLYVNRDKPHPVVLNDQSVFRVQGKVAAATEIHIGIGAFGTTRASAGRFITSRNVTGEFDLEIPVNQFRPFRGRGGDLSVIGMEVFAWFCLTSDANAELEISAVELQPASN
jgi:hypothetical protein